MILVTALPLFAGGDLPRMLQQLEEEWKDETWNHLGASVTSYSYDEMLQLGDASDYLNIEEASSGLLLVCIVYLNETQNYAALKEKDRTTWITFPEGFLRIEQAQRAGDYLIFNGYYRIDNFERFVFAYRKTDKGWQQAPEVFRSIPKQAGNFELSQGSLIEGEGELDGLIVWYADEDRASDMVPVKLGASASVTIGDAGKSQIHLAWTTDRFVLKK